jgi:PTS system galactitol-specific IIC component
MQRRFPGRTFYVGLDWPVLAGVDAIWAVGVLVSPITLILAFLLPYNSTLPFASIIMVSLVVTATVLTQGDIVKSTILSAIGVPVYLAAASYFAPYFTQLAQQTAVVQIPPGSSMVTWLEMNAAGLRLMVFSVLDLLNGRVLPGLLFVGLLPVLGWYYVRTMKRRERAAASESGGIAGVIPYPEVDPAGVPAPMAGD